jgi:carbon monoxide dehydrogenase subunit G
MQVRLARTVAVSAPAPLVWKVVQDIKDVAACMPGAEITDQVDDTHYNGRVKVKLGPVTAAFKGQLEILSIDPEKMAIRVRGKGTEEKGTSAASLEMIAAIKSIDSARSEISGSSEATVTGKLATFGARMMTQMADQLIDQFVANLNNYLLASSAGAQRAEASARVQTQPRELNVLRMLLQMLWGFIKSFLRLRSA